MTDLATKPSDASDGDDTGSEATTDTAVLAEWAPAEPAARKKHLGWWIGAPSGVLVLALVAASLILIAPGTAVAGVNVGWMTAGGAAGAIDSRLDDTTVTLTGPGGDATVSARDLGVSIDASAAADAAFADHPFWNPSTWFAEAEPATLTLDADTAQAAIREVAPTLYVDPVDATVAFDAKSSTFAVTDAEPGQGVDTDALTAALQAGFDAGSTAVSFEAEPTVVAASADTPAAQSTADSLNAMLGGIGFYVGEERTVPVDAATAASWITVAPDDENGSFVVSADPAKIQASVDGLAAAVDRAPVDATVITDTAGKVLRDEVAGVTGRTVGDTSDVAEGMADQIATGNGNYQLNVEETPFATTTLARKLEVNLSTQTTTLWENGNVVRSYTISSGKAATPTDVGNFRVYAHTSIQDLGAACYGSTDPEAYCTEDVPWLTWYNGDEAFHGTYWHNNFGTPMSHGCVNMPIDVAKFVYDWSPVGTEVSVHY